MLALFFLFIGIPAFSAPPDYVEGEVLVRYQSQALVSARDAALRLVGAKAVRELARQNTVLLKLPKGQTVAGAIEKLRKSSDVELVQPNYIYRISATPNDPHYPSLWGLENSGQQVDAGTLGPDSPNTEDNPGTSGFDMDLELAWNRISSCSGVTVAVIDTGIRYTHEDLINNMWQSGDVAIPHHGWNVITGAGDPTDPADDNGHGTHVAGTIGAEGDNNKGTTGVCWNVKLMAIKALAASGSGTSFDVATGITWAVDHGAKVINMSLGSGSADSNLELALEYARTKDVVVVTAAGNDGTSNDSTPVYPCNYKKANMICVAALTQTYALASFSNFGSSYVDVGAPGVNIVSPWPYTFSKITDDFTGGDWNPSGGTGNTSFAPVTVGTYKTLAIPDNWTSSSGSNHYATNVTAQAYKSFHLTGSASKVLLDFMVLNNLGATGTTSLKAYYAVGSTDPIGANLLDTYTGQTGGFAYGKSYDLTSSCSNATCSVGFQFQSDPTVTDTGALILNFSLLKLSLADTGYNVIQGTSMAAPHVAGLAAMILAYQPGYTALNVVDSLKNGGEATSSLTHTTTTGKAVNAVGSLSYITAPTSVSLSKE